MSSTGSPDESKQSWDSALTSPDPNKKNDSPSADRDSIPQGSSMRLSIDEALLKAETRIQNLVSLKANEVERSPWEMASSGERNIIFVPPKFDADSVFCQMMIRMAKDRNFEFGVAGNCDANITWSITTPNKEDTIWMTSSMLLWSAHPIKNYSTANLDGWSLFEKIMWIKASERAVRVNQTKVDAYDCVLPSKVNRFTIDDAFNKAVSKISGLLGSGGTQAMKTYRFMLDMWIKRKDIEDISITLIRSQKIKWKHVTSAAPKKLVRIKAQGRGKPTQAEVFDVPPQPLHTAWLTVEEKNVWPQGCFPEWRAMDAIGKEWEALTSEEQHDQLKDYRGQLKTIFSRMKTYQQEVSKSVGARKKHVEEALKQARISIPEKDQKPSVKVSRFMTRFNLPKLHESTKRAFCPANYLGNRGNAKTILNHWKIMEEESVDERIEVALNLAPDKDAKGNYQVTSAPIMIWWLKRFEPNIKKEVTADEISNDAVKIMNRFQALKINDPGSDIVFSVEKANAALQKRKEDDLKLSDQKFNKLNTDTKSYLATLTETEPDKEVSPTVLDVARERNHMRSIETQNVKALQTMNDGTFIRYLKNKEPVIFVPSSVTGSIDFIDFGDQDITDYTSSKTEGGIIIKRQRSPGSINPWNPVTK